jgi:DNA polymerase I-like protein with 3'-5' exonuclease and polymerase domains
VSHPYQNIIKEISESDAFAVEPFRGNRGIFGIAVSNGEKYWFIPKKEGWDDFLKELFSLKNEIICFDMRRIMDFPIDDASIVDMKTILGGGEGSLLNRMKEHFALSPITVRLADIEQRAAANYRAIRAAQVDVSQNFDKTMTPEFFNDYLKSRCVSIKRLYDKFERSTEVDDWFRRLNFIKSLHEVEQNGIRIDKDFVDTQLLKQQDPATAKSLRSMQSLYKNGYVTALFNASGTKTGRLRPEGGFGAMGIPHGTARKAIISRFEDGKIYSFDYNAIDYRSIVSTIGGPFAQLYEGQRDFHTRTAQFVFKDVDDVRREAFKAIAYTSIYGGSENTLSQRTGLPTETIKKVLSLLEPHMRPVAEFRDKLWGEWQINGFIDIPGVGVYRKNNEEDMHPGKLLALYAQGYSAYVFERAFTEVHGLLKANGRGSCIIFPVHDELVLDIHPEDEVAGIVSSIKTAMETGVADGFVVNYKKGRSYGEVE